MSLGPPVKPEKPAEPEWTPVPSNPKFERNRAGQWRTRQYEPVPVYTKKEPKP